MGQIYLRGRAFRSLAGGSSWWLLISGWILFGSLAFIILILTITSWTITTLPALIISLIPILILWRGTVAKLTSKKSKGRRR